MNARTPALALATLAAATVADLASAVPCAGFTDVDDTSPFCQNVQWIKNRKVTLGCTVTTYCPSEPVQRVQMAALLNRLGTALTPQLTIVDLPVGALDLGTTPVVCQTPDQAIADYPRRAVLDATFSGSAAAGVDISVKTVYSLNAGATWQPVAAVPGNVFVPAVQWGQGSDLGVLDLNVGQTVRFGVQVTRVVAGGTNLTDSHCRLRTQVVIRDGTSAPF